MGRYLFKADRNIVLPSGANVLTERENQVMFLIARGFSNKEVADRLFTSVQTIETHRKKIKEKTNTRNASELTILCIAKEQGCSPKDLLRSPVKLRNHDKTDRYRSDRC